MEIIIREINDLKPAPYNPRQATEKQYQDLKNSIGKFGIVDPIIVNKRNNRIVGGHFRVRVAKDMGITEVPCVFVDLDEKQEQELNIRLNANIGYFDYELLTNYEFEDLVKFGFDEKELEINFGINNKAQEKEKKLKKCPKCKYQW